MHFFQALITQMEIAHRDATSPDEVSQNRTRADEEPLQKHPNKQPLNQPRKKRSGSAYSKLGPEIAYTPILAHEEACTLD
ncbi:hypothetical protein ACFX1Q_004635 [Malus domestica]